jgi:hypothetical protein
MIDDAYFNCVKKVVWGDAPTAIYAGMLEEFHYEIKRILINGLGSERLF